MIYIATLARGALAGGTRCRQSSQALVAGLRGFCAFLFACTVRHEGYVQKTEKLEGFANSKGFIAR